MHVMGLPTAAIKCYLVLTANSSLVGGNSGLTVYVCRKSIKNISYILNLTIRCRNAKKNHDNFYREVGASLSLFID